MKKLTFFLSLLIGIEGYFCWQEWALRPLAVVAFLLAAFLFIGSGDEPQEK